MKGAMFFEGNYSHGYW